MAGRTLKAKRSAAVRKARAWAVRMARREAAKKAARSAAARKGWETRRAKAKKKQAADLGIGPTRWDEFEWNGSVWDSVAWGKEVDRGVLKMMDEAARNPAYGMDPAKFADEYCRIPDILRGLPPDPNPWPRLAAKVRRWWKWLSQWWRR